MNETTLTITGSLTADPELRFTPAGTAPRCCGPRSRSPRPNAPPALWRPSPPMTPRHRRSERRPVGVRESDPAPTTYSPSNNHPRKEQAQ
ncbi:MAG: hypothetical protein LC749_21645 [Actinobacteria bacterium]|nr:hypothetical protein [Actinomycetota bacterium]